MGGRGSFGERRWQYLISRIENSSHITVYPESEIVALGGDPSLQRVTWVNSSTGERTSRDISVVFVMIGADPNTSSLFATVPLDKKALILPRHTHPSHT